MRQDDDRAVSWIPEDMVRSAHAIQYPASLFKPAFDVAT